MITQRTILVALCLACGCATAGEPMRSESTAPAATREVEAPPAPEGAPVALGGSTGEGGEAAPPERPRAAIVPAPIAPEQRLAPCAVELTHTTYDEETRAPTSERHPVFTLTRDWTDHLRETEWRGVAPIPLTRDQARALLPDPSELDVGRGIEIFAEVGDGALHYRFDAEGRTTSVSWDPTADSSSYEYAYRYRCSAGARQPRYDEGSARSE